MIKRIISALALILFLSNAFAQTNPMLELKTEIKPGHYKLKQVIDLLTSKGTNVTYNANMVPVQSEFEITEANPSVKQLLEIIKKSLPVEYQVKGDFIILKKRKSNTKYKVSGSIMNTGNNEPLIGASIYIRGAPVWRNER